MQRLMQYPGVGTATNRSSGHRVNDVDQRKRDDRPDEEEDEARG